MLVRKIITVASDVGVDLVPNDISDIQTMWYKEGQKTRPFVCFVNRRKKTELMRSKKNLKGIYKYKYTYINEDLTGVHYKIMKIAKSQPGVVCFLQGWEDNI